MPREISWGGKEGTYAILPVGAWLVRYGHLQHIIDLAGELVEASGIPESTQFIVEEGIAKASGMRQTHAQGDAILLLLPDGLGRVVVLKALEDLDGLELRAEFLSCVCRVEIQFALLDELQGGDCCHELGAGCDPEDRV